MPNRFTLKDLLLFVLIIAVLVSVWLAMIQSDLENEVVRDFRDQLEQQNDNLATIAREQRDTRVALVELGEGNQTLNANLAQLVEVLNRRRPPANGDAAGNGEANGGDDPIAITFGNGDEGLLDDEKYFYRLMEPRSRPNFAYGDWFIDSFRQTVGKLTPIIATDAYQSAVEGFVLESLITRDPNTFEWRPWIAKSWQVADDGLTITYDLRRDVVFSDGQPLTADDVVFTYQWIMNPDVNAPALRTYYDNFESVTADGDYRVVFRMKRPYFRSLDFSGGMAILARHFYEQFTPEQFNEMPGLLFGSGPYKLAVPPEQWRPGTGKIELDRNNQYWGPRPTFDKLVFREIRDETAQLTSFRNRGIDRFGISPEKYPRLRNDQDLLDHANLHVYEAPNFGYRYIGWNQQREGEPTAFADKRVRQAMTLLANRKEMAKQLMSGLARVATGPFNPLGQQADPDIEPWPYDPEKAKQLLAEAGWVDRDDDGVLENADGKEFRFSLIFPAGSANYQQMAYYLRDAYARAGIVMEPAETEWNTMLQRIDERKFDAMTLAWTGNIEGDPKQIFHSDSIEGGGHNYITYRNERLDELIDTARVTMDEQERMPMWHEVNRIFHEDQPYTFLFFSKTAVFIDQRMQNVQITKMGMNDRTEMFVPKSMQLWTK